MGRKAKLMVLTAVLLLIWGLMGCEAAMENQPDGSEQMEGIIVDADSARMYTEDYEGSAQIVILSISSETVFTGRATKELQLGDRVSVTYSSIAEIAPAILEHVTQVDISGAASEDQLRAAIEFNQNFL